MKEPKKGTISAVNFKAVSGNFRMRSPHHLLKAYALTHGLGGMGKIIETSKDLQKGKGEMALF